MAGDDMCTLQQQSRGGADVESGAAPAAQAENVKPTSDKQALRWKNHAAALCMVTIVAFNFGASPLVDSLNAEAPSALGLGITTFATQSLCANLVILPVFGSVMKLLNYKGMLIWLVVVSGALFPLSIGLAASTKQFWIAYLGAVLASPALLIAVEGAQVMVVQWWALDGKQREGVALFGCMFGMQILLMTLALGYTCQYWGIVRAAYAQATLFVFASLWPLRLALRGELGPPPSVEANVISSPVKEKDWTFSCSVFQICLHSFLTVLPGFGMKMLLTSIFQDAYDVSFLSSANWSALTLVLYAVARGVFPLVAKPGSVMPLQMGMLFFTGALYGSYPVIIQNLPIWCLAAVKTITGGCFAGLLSMQSLLLLEVYEPRELPAAFRISQPCQSIGFTFGPVIGYYLHLLQKSQGIGEQHSYNLWFYMCAALYIAAGVNMLVLQARLSIRSATAKVASTA